MLGQRIEGENVLAKRRWRSSLKIKGGVIYACGFAMKTNRLVITYFIPGEVMIVEEQGINEIIPVIYQLNETKYYLLTGSSGYPSATYSSPCLLSGYGENFVILEDRVKTAEIKL